MQNKILIVSFNLKVYIFICKGNIYFYLLLIINHIYLKRTLNINKIEYKINIINLKLRIARTSRYVIDKEFIIRIESTYFT